MRRLIVVVVLLTIASLQTAIAQCKSGNCINGKGTFLFSSGARYIGAFQNGKMHGDGALYFNNGNKYFGQFKEQYREGKGKMVFSNGDEFRGHFKKSKMSGRGTMKFANGDFYEGKWADDQPHGKGKYVFADGKKYDGDLYDGKIHGKGTMIYADGSQYIGTWLNNYKNGQGTLTQTDGTKLDGFWENGRFLDGDGDTPSDSGIAQQSNSNVGNSSSATSSASENISDKNIRDCNIEDCYSGEGKFTYSDGSRYIGEFKNKYPEGHGTCFYSNGDKYVGGWKNHAPDGEGIMTYSYGKVVGALWDQGRVLRELDNNDVPVGNEYVEVDNNDKVKIWSVVVGVARYKHMPVLKYTDDDAYHTYAFLKSPEGGALPDEQVRVLIDEDATRDRILRTMRSVFLKADENDVVLLYFSGHGLPGSFLPVDFDGFNNKVHHDEIKAIFEESKAKHKICLADACHSGTLMAMRSPTLENTLKKYYTAFDQSTGGTALLMSSKGEEYSLEDQGLRRGIFSHYMIRGMKGEADENGDKIVTITELFDFTHKKVRTYTGNAQSPTLTGEFDPRMPVAVIR